MNLLSEKLYLLFVFPEKIILHQTHLSVYSACVDHLAVQLLRHQHIIELSVLILCRQDIDLVNAVGEADLREHPVDIPSVAVGRLDFPVYGCDHVVPQGMIDKLILFPEFFFIFRFKIGSGIVPVPDRKLHWNVLRP